jgi:hypothetical protein
MERFIERKKEAMERGSQSMGLSCSDLNLQAKQWATARATDGSHGGPNQQGSKGDTMLPSEAANWATPNVPTRGAEKRYSKAKRNAGGEDTQTQAANWPTASARDHKGAPAIGSRDRLTWQLDEAAQSFPQAETTTDDGLNSLLAVWTAPACPRLSPAFQWWLMGWPHPQTFFGLAATESTHSAQRGPSSTCSRASWMTWKHQIILTLCSMVLAAEQN